MGLVRVTGGGPLEWGSQLGGAAGAEAVRFMSVSLGGRQSGGEALNVVRWAVIIVSHLILPHVASLSFPLITGLDTDQKGEEGLEVK